MPGDNPLVGAIAARLITIPAVTGYEQGMIDTLLHLVPGAVRDRAGNAVLMLPGPAPKRLVVCPLDEPGYVVGGVREDGYATLRRVPGPVPPLFTQQLEGQRVTVWEERGPVAGVVGVRSIHLTRGAEPGPDRPFSIESAFVDVGARTAAAALRLGVRVLAPVTLAKRAHAYGRELLAAPSAGRRGACASLVVAARRAVARTGMSPRRQGAVVAFVVEQRLSGRGLATVSRTLGPFAETVIVDGGEGSGSTVDMTDTLSAARWPALGRVTRWTLPVRYSGSPVETVRVSDADSLAGRITRWIDALP